jgi:hypothetical protein
VLGIATEFSQITGPAGVILDKGVVFVRVGLKALKASGSTAAVLITMPARVLSHVKLKQWDELAGLAQGTFKLSMAGGGNLAKRVLRDEVDVAAVNRLLPAYSGNPNAGLLDRLLDTRFAEHLKRLGEIYTDPDAVRGALRALADIKDASGAVVRLSDDAVEGAVKFMAKAGNALPPEAREDLLRQVLAGGSDEATPYLLFFRRSRDPQAIEGFAKYLSGIPCPVP